MLASLPGLRQSGVDRMEGVDEVMEAIEKHLGWMSANGELQRRRRARAADEIEAIVLGQLRSRMGDLRGRHSIDELAERVVTGETDPYRASDSVLADLT